MAELDLTNIAASAIATPAPGVTALFADTDKRLKTKDDAGFVRVLAGLQNVGTAVQTPAATVRTYIVGSAIAVPFGKLLQVGTVLRWTFTITKTAAGVAASTYDVCVGINGTTADVARVSFVKPAGDATVDEGKIVIEATVRSIGAAGVMLGEFTLVHNGFAAGAGVGHALIPCVVVNTISAAFDMTVPNLIVGLCITSGAADAITIQQVFAEAFNV